MRLLALLCLVQHTLALKGANPALKAASAVVTPLLKPLYKIEAPLQAKLTSLLSSQDEAQIKAEIDDQTSSAPCVVYTYALSPFSTEALAILDASGANYQKRELGLEWFLLGPKESAVRSLLGDMTGQTSLPHVFIGGEWVGGLCSGGSNGGGISALAESGELEQKLKAARAL